MKQVFLFLLAGLLWTGVLSAQNGHNIQVKIDGYEQPELYLAYYLGDKQYILDTTKVGKDGFYTFSGEEKLAGGIYLVVMAPDNQFFQILVDDRNQQFSLQTQKADPVTKASFRSSKDNELFYGYLNYLNQKRPEAEALQKEMEAQTDETKKVALQAKLDQLNKSVEDYQRKFVADHPGSFPAAIVKANLPLDMPEFTGSEEEVQMQRWRWTQKHYFDNLDLADPRMLRTPFLFSRLDYFVNKLQVQHPDSLSLAIDQVMKGLQPAEESFKYYLIHFLNSFARSTYVGMDAVYVHLVDNYYAKGLAPWTDAEQLEKIVDNANTLRPLLIGRTAPDIELERRNGERLSLHDVDAPYTVLYFWRYDCGHCKESTPHLKEFYQKFKDKGVKIFSVCTKFGKDIAECWKYVDDNQLGDFIQVVDPYLRSQFNAIYDIKTTPQIYILDRDKKIVSKKISAEQLEEVMDQLLEQKAQEKQLEQMKQK